MSLTEWWAMDLLCTRDIISFLWPVLWKFAALWLGAKAWRLYRRRRKAFVADCRGSVKGGGATWRK